MNLDQLKQLDAIARYGTLSAVSRVLHISQPALSRSIQRLEAELGQELFTRSRNRIELNDAGLIALEHARSILREERVMRDEFVRLSQRRRMLLVGTVAPVPVWHLTAITVERFPGTILQPIALDHDEIVSRLLEGSVDFAVTIEPLELPSCRSHHFMREQLFASIPVGHPLCEQEHVSFSQLDGEAFLVDSSAGIWLDIARKQMPHARIIEQADRTVLFKLLESSEMLSFTSNITMDWYQDLSRANIPIADEEAALSFYLTTLVNAQQTVSDIFNWASRQDPLTSRPNVR